MKKYENPILIEEIVDLEDVIAASLAGIGSDDSGVGNIGDIQFK